ncbi:MAG: hypothetical protein J7M13_02485 [Synergistetes bacterium]|nr:hypothetical protein [Synergistota bacterium]
MWGFGRGWGGGFGRGWGMGYGRFMGRGNPYPFCRFYPWLPRGWWRTGMAPYMAAPYYYYRPPMTYAPYYW